MTFLEAAESVLRASGKPMHYRVIANTAMGDGRLTSGGKTPQHTMCTVLSSAVRKRGAGCRFVRTSPGHFGLREWVADGGVSAPLATSEADLRVRIPHFPVYESVRKALSLMEGFSAKTITGARSTIYSQRGNPQANKDWSEPASWIPAYLEGEQARFARHLWEGSGHTINPRHFLGHWLLARRYALISEGAGGVLQITERGRTFLSAPNGAVVREVDDREGVFKALSLVAENGPARKGALFDPWRIYLAEVSNARSDSYANSTLYDRLKNLRARGYVELSRAAYSITSDGLAWLDHSDESEAAPGGDAYQQILNLARSQKQEISDTLHELLHEMDPYAFEHMVAQLLDNMGYDNPQVTPRGNDKGVDVVASIEMGITTIQEVIQVKRQRNNIQRPVLDALRGSLHRFRADRGTIITTSGFSKGTVDAAIELGAAPITLIDGHKLVELLIEHGIGVKKKPIEIWELDASAFDAESEEADEG